MNNSHRFHGASRLAAVAVAATAFIGASAFAEGPNYVPDDSPDRPVWMQVAAPTQARTAAPLAAVEGPMQTAAATDPTYTYTPASTVGPATRAQVREELNNWRLAGILNPGGEIGDTTETLAARDAYNEMQTEVITARWADETQRMVKAREAEYAAQLARDEIEAVLAAAAREQSYGTAALDPVANEVPMDGAAPVMSREPQAADLPVEAPEATTVRE